MHGIAYDPVHDEVLVPNPLAAAILVFRGGAKGDEAPVRVIQGGKTQLSFPHSLSIDVQNNEIIVGDPGGKKVLVFPLNATGDVAPLRVIEGDKTRLGYVVGVAADPVNNLLVISSFSSAGNGLFIFNRADNGNLAPRAAIAGSNTGIRGGPWQVQVWQGKIFVSVANIDYRPLYHLDKPRVGPDTEIISPWNDMKLGLGFIGVWNITDNGDVPPRAIVRGPASGLLHPSGIALNPEFGEVMATDSVRNGTFTYLVPEFFRN